MSVEMQNTGAVRTFSEAIRDTLLAPWHSPACLSCEVKLLLFFLLHHFPCVIWNSKGQSGPSVPLRLLSASSSGSSSMKLPPGTCSGLYMQHRQGSMGCWARGEQWTIPAWIMAVGLTVCSAVGDTSPGAAGRQLGKQLLSNY